MTKMSATRRKRRGPPPKKRQTAAAKKKHVRELSKVGRWGEIEQLYGKKSLANAKIDAQPYHVKKTPLEIAHEILVKNGYLPSASPVVAAVTTVETSTSGDMLRDETTATAQQTYTSRSPETLTTDQLNLIERRRQEALARRKRAQAAGRPHGNAPIVIRPDSAEDRRAVGPMQKHHFRPSAGQPTRMTHRVVTPENLPMTDQVVETEHARPQCFWDDLEAAAEIVQWENEQMADVTLATTATDFDPEVGSVQHEVRHHTEVEAANPVVSLSQELLAAAEIIQWEKEHEVSPEVSAFNKQDDSDGSGHELDAPQFQLLPVHITDDSEQHYDKLPESVRPHDNNNITSHQDFRRNNSQPKSKAHDMVAPSSSAHQHSSALSSKAATSSEEHQRNSTSSCSSLNQRDPTTEFIDKHLLEDKLELPVLEFLDMMLA